jgi:hypothetical protein
MSTKTTTAKKPNSHGAKALGLCLVSSVALTGCSGVIFKPFDADKGSLSMDARQRTIVSVERGTPPDTHRIICAEPSPDALATIAASGGLSGGVSGIPAVPGSVDLATSFSNAEQAAFIGARNSTIQLLRDGLYRACEAYMNGALGDFGYGLVLVNYGKVMVSLITAEGLARPPLAPPVVIGSAQGAVNTSAQGSGATPAPKAAAGGAAAGGGTAASHTASAGAGAGAALPAMAPVTPAAPGTINEQTQLIFERVVLPLANASEDPVSKFMEVAVACMVWLDDTGIKKQQPGNDVMTKFCTDTVEAIPALAGPAIKERIQEVSAKMAQITSR